MVSVKDKIRHIQNNANNADFWLQNNNQFDFSEVVRMIGLRIVDELNEIGVNAAKQSLHTNIIPGGRSTGDLIDSIRTKPAVNKGNFSFSGIIFAGDGKATYAGIVDKIGWSGREPYYYMRDGAQTMVDNVPTVVKKHFDNL